MNAAVPPTTASGKPVAMPTSLGLPPPIDDALWEQIEPQLPPAAPRNHQYAGRKPTPDRQILNGIVWVLVQDISWNELPSKLGFGSGTSCWQRLRSWDALGLWPDIQTTLIVGWHARGMDAVALAFQTNLRARTALNAQIARSRNSNFNGTIRLVIGFGGGISERVAGLIQQTVSQRLQARIEVAPMVESLRTSEHSDRGITLVLGGAWLASHRSDGQGIHLGESRLTPITPVLAAPFAFVVPRTSPHLDWSSLLLHTERSGAAPVCATPSIGTRAHLYLNQVSAATGITFRTMACAGGGDQVRAVLQGTADCAVMSLVTAMPLLRQGCLRALAFSTPSRMQSAPDIPSMAELGHPALQARTWLALYGANDLASKVVKRLALETSLAFKSPEARSFMHALGATHPSGGAARIDRLLHDESHLANSFLQPAALSLR